MEIERKYLVPVLPEGLETFTHTDIEQGYLCTSPTLRIRKMGAACILTVKERMHTDSTAIVNREEEFVLADDRYALLRTKCDGNMVSKTRYRIPLGNGLTAELDIFHGSHEGLRIVEVEFPSTEVSEAFVPPAWFGREVSGDRRYSNSWLSMHGNGTATDEYTETA